MKHRWTSVRRDPFPVGTLIISLVLCLVLLAACDTNARSTTTGSSGVPMTATGTNTTTVPTRTPLPTTQKCGVVQAMRMLVIPPDQNPAKDVEDCFWRAYQQCHPATLIYAQNGLDTGTISTFSLKSENGTCVITDDVQQFMVPHAPQPTTSDICTGLTKQNDGLHFLSCGDRGDVLVPEDSTGSVGTQTPS